MSHEHKTLKQILKPSFKIQACFQPMMRTILLSLANYHPQVEGEFPSAPFLALPYPHGEHLDSLLLPARTEKLVYVAARDTFFSNWLVRFFLPLVLDAIPISRNGDFSRERFKSELSKMQNIVSAGHNLVIYPQGSRLGPATSADQLADQIKPGVFLIARLLANAGTTIVPVGIIHASNYDPQKGGVSAGQVLKNNWPQRPPRQEVTIRIGEQWSDLPSNKNAFRHELAQRLWDVSQR